MLQSSLQLFFWRRLPFSAFSFPRWRSVLAISAIGALSWLDPEIRTSTSLITVLLSTWIAFLVSLLIISWWIRRGGRWDGQGNLFNLVATSWLVTNAAAASLSLLGAPLAVVLLLLLYSIAITGNALAGAVRGLSLSYGVGGVLVAVIPALVVSTFSLVIFP